MTALLRWLRTPATKRLALLASLLVLGGAIVATVLLLYANHTASAIIVILFSLPALFLLAWSSRRRADDTARLATLIAAITEGRPVTLDHTLDPALRGALESLIATLKELRIESAYRQAVVEYAVDGMIIIDEDDRIASFNPAAERIFGFRAEEVIGHGIELLIPDPAHRQYKLISIGDEVVGRRSDGSSFPMDLTSGQMRLGDRRFYIGIARDASRRKQVEEDLQRARQVAEAANRAKTTFLANMSHELRTPLNAIIGYSEMLIEEAEDLEQTELIPDLQRISDAGLSLLTLIDDILTVSRMETGAIQRQDESFSVAMMVRDLVVLARPLAQKNANTLHIECPPMLGAVRTDQTKLRKVVHNLLSNACKFTERGSVRLEVLLEESGLSKMRTVEGQLRRAILEIKVQDTGIGIDKEQIQKLFQPFSQIDDSSTRRYGGSGLGLAIAQYYTQLLGGTIQVHSTPGSGSTFIVRLPVEVVEAQVSEEEDRDVRR